MALITEVHKASHAPAASTATRCIATTELFSTALRTNNVSAFFTPTDQPVDLEPLPRSISVQKTDLSGGRAHLEIDFFDNRLVTYFQGEDRSIKLSNALGIIRDLAEIFDQMQSAGSTESTAALEDMFTHALDTSTASASNVKLVIKGKEMAAFYPLTQRVVLSTSRGQSSIPLEIIQGCAHLFNRQFAEKICPLLNLGSNVSNLQMAIHKIYLGRCILGLKRGMDEQRFTQLGYERERGRIVTHILMPGFAFYSSPIF